MRIVRELDEREWAEFVQSHPNGNIFHTPEMFQVFAHAKGHQPELWAVLSDDGRVLALFLPVQISLYAGILRYFSTRSIVYGGVLAAPGEEGVEALKLVLAAYKRDKSGYPLFTELRNLSILEDIQPALNQSDFTFEDHLNYVIKLDPFTAVMMERIGPRTRKHIRRALRSKIVDIAEVVDSRSLDACYDLLKRTYQNARVPLADRSLFDAAFKLLHPKDMIRFTLASVDGEPAAASVELLYKHKVYGWYGGMDRTYSSATPNELLTWHILTWSAEKGYTEYDFGGAGKPDEEYGVRNFKAKFGGELVNFGRNTYIHAPGRLRLSELGYSFMRLFI